MRKQTTLCGRSYTREARGAFADWWQLLLTTGLPILILVAAVAFTVFSCEAVPA